MLGNVISKCLSPVLGRRSYAAYTAVSDQASLESYRVEHRQSIENKIDFWDHQASKYVHWNKRYDNVLGGTTEQPKWFDGGHLNICYNSLDRHVKDLRLRDRLAITHEIPLRGVCTKITFGELYEQVCLMSGALVRLGVVKGDTVVIYMPNIIETAVAMLACARLGATHSVVFGGFASAQLAARIDHCRPKVVISANIGLDGFKVIHYTELLSKALEIATHKPDHTIIYSRQDISDESSTNIAKVPNALDWLTLIRLAQPSRDYTIVESSHPLYVLYTSGTTGSPKGIVRDTGGYAVALSYMIGGCYGLDEGDVFASMSDYDAGVYWRMVQDHRVNSLFSAPTAIRAIQRDDPQGLLPSKYDMSSLRSIWLGGERGDPTTLKNLADSTKVPVFDNYWQTESGWPMISNSRQSVPIRYGSAGMPIPGADLHVIGEDGKSMPDGETGEILSKLPLPPGYCTALFGKDHEAYRNAYLINRGDSTWYRTGDAGFKDKDGYFYIMARVDDIINVSGHRLSTASIEEIIYSNSDIAECAVIGAHDDIKGEIPLGFIVMKTGVTYTPEIERSLIKAVRDRIGPIATFKRVLAVKRLPKTRSEDMDVPKEIEQEFKKFLAPPCQL
eukprot:gene6785-7887_t